MTQNAEDSRFIQPELIEAIKTDDTIHAMFVFQTESPNDVRAYAGLEAIVTHAADDGQRMSCSIDYRIGAVLYSGLSPVAAEILTLGNLLHAAHDTSEGGHALVFPS